MHANIMLSAMYVHMLSLIMIHTVIPLLYLCTTTLDDFTLCSICIYLCIMLMRVCISQIYTVHTLKYKIVTVFFLLSP